MTRVSLRRFHTRLLSRTLSVKSQERRDELVTDFQIVCRLQNIYFFYGYSERRLVFVNFVFPVLNINCIILDKRFVERLSAVSGNSASSS